MMSVKHLFIKSYQSLEKGYIGEQGIRSWQKWRVEWEYHPNRHTQGQGHVGTCPYALGQNYHARHQKLVDEQLNK